MEEKTFRKIEVENSDGKDWFTVATYRLSDMTVIHRSEKTDSFPKAQRYLRIGSFTEPKKPMTEPKKQRLPPLRQESVAERSFKLKQAMSVLKPKRNVTVFKLPDKLTPELLAKSRKIHESLVTSIMVTSSIRKRAKLIQLQQARRREKAGLIIMI